MITRIFIGIIKIHITFFFDISNVSCYIDQSCYDIVREYKNQRKYSTERYVSCSKRYMYITTELKQYRMLMIKLNVYEFTWVKLGQNEGI